MSLYLGNQKVTPTVVYKDNKKFTQVVVGSISVLTTEDLKDVTRIRGYAFKGCSSLTSVTIPDSVTSIGSSAFSSCSGLTSITIGNGVTSIGGWAFSSCSRLTSVTIPDSVTSIGDGAFDTCSGLTSITIPDSVTSIGDYAFRYCSRLKNIYITDLAAWCKIFGLGELMLYGSNEKNLYLNGELVTNLTIPDSVTSIGSSAFYGCSGLTSVTIPNSVTSIGNYAFYNCSSLTSVTMLSTTPPTFASSIFDSSFSGTIIVPAGTGDAYKAATNWSKYADKIQEATV